MKPHTFDFKTPPSFLQQLHSLHRFIFLSHMLFYEKNSENSLCLKNFDEIKSNEISRI